MGETTWSTERVDALKALALAGKSATQIACELGDVSRNAVISKINRGKFEWTRRVERNNHTPGIPRKRIRRPRPVRATEQSLPVRQHILPPWIAARGEPTPPLVRELPPEPIAATHVTFMELTADTCRWPIGDPVELFCGALPAHGLVYCPHHCRMAYVKPKRVAA